MEHGSGNVRMTPDLAHFLKRGHYSVYAPVGV
jgi:hypothetical protein